MGSGEQRFDARIGKLCTHRPAPAPAPALCHCYVPDIPHTHEPIPESAPQDDAAVVELPQEERDSIEEILSCHRTTTAPAIDMGMAISEIERIVKRTVARRGMVSQQDEIVERLYEALENLIDGFRHNPLCECKNCKAKAVLIAARKEAGMFYRNGTANELAAQKNRIAELDTHV
jgi:hypothetical protein